MKASSYVKYFNLINKHILPVFDDLAVTDITSKELGAFAAEQLANGRLNGPGGLSVKTVKRLLSLINAVLLYAKESGFAAETARPNILLPREKQKSLRVLSVNEQTALERYLCDDMDAEKLGVMLCLYTGLRIGEICALSWRSISLENQTLTVGKTMQRLQTLGDESGKKTSLIITEPKSDSSIRVIPLPGWLIDMLARFHPACEDAFVLTGEKDRCIEPRALQNHFKAYLAASGLPDINFHALRHTFATRCVTLGFDIKALSEILGHSSVNITLNRYVHPSFEFKQSNMEKLYML